MKKFHFVEMGNYLCPAGNRKGEIFSSGSAFEVTVKGFWAVYEFAGAGCLF